MVSGPSSSRSISDCYRYKRHQGWVPFGNPSLYHHRVSNTLELSRHSSFQSSLTVLVCYWYQVIFRIMRSLSCIEYEGGFGRSDANTSCSYFNWAQWRKRFTVSGPSLSRRSSHLDHDRFACQNRYGRPSGFPLTWTRPGDHKHFMKLFTVSRPSLSRSSLHFHHNRFARHNRCGPLLDFPLTSTLPVIVHHLAGPNMYSLYCDNPTQPTT